MWKRAVCTKDCPDTCGLLVNVENGQVVTIKAIRIILPVIPPVGQSRPTLSIFQDPAGGVTDDTQAGLLVAEGLHWPSLSLGGGSNQLTSQRFTDMGKTCAFHCNLVEVQPQGN